MLFLLHLILEFFFQERLVQLEVEQGDEKVKGDKEMDVLIEELKHLKSLIETANHTSDKPLDIYCEFKLLASFFVDIK